MILGGFGWFRVVMEFVDSLRNSRVFFEMIKNGVGGLKF